METEGCFAYGLDSEKKQITTVASNTGHCLWSGIADQDKAERTARLLLQDDMWSGWGIRTISNKNPAFNPFSYHLGSVWPHDNGIIAAGFKRYELPREANIPQAWASGSVFQMLQTILGLRAEAPHKRLYVNPTLPEWLPELQIQRLAG